LKSPKKQSSPKTTKSTKTSSNSSARKSPNSSTSPRPKSPNAAPSGQNSAAKTTAPCHPSSHPHPPARFPAASPPSASPPNSSSQSTLTTFPSTGSKPSSPALASTPPATP
jgi:hypothetical protein